MRDGFRQNWPTQTALTVVVFVLAALGVAVTSRAARAQHPSSMDQAETHAPWKNGGQPYASFAEDREEVGSGKTTSGKITFDPLLGLVLPFANGVPLPSIKEILHKAT